MLDGEPRGLGIEVEESLPSEGEGGVDVFGSIVEEDELGAVTTGAGLDDEVEGGVGFHGVVLEGEDVMIEEGEEGVVLADMIDLEFVGIGEDGGGCAV